VWRRELPGGLFLLAGSHLEVAEMCLKGKKTAPEKPGNFKCKKCGATSKKKGDLCEPKKIK
jgi:hypothetical protein